jgi:replicative DNA helicase
MPHNIEREQALLGAIILNNEAYGRVAGMVAPEHFFEPLHARIFSEAARQISDGKKVTPLTLKDAFPADYTVGHLSVSQYLARLASEATTVICAPDYAVGVRDQAVMREIIAVGQDLQRAGENFHAPDEALKVAWDKLDLLRADTVPNPGERGSLSTLVDRFIEAQEGGTRSDATGLIDFDSSISGGLRPGRLYVFAGRPGMGKTVLGISICRRMARRNVFPAIFSLEIDGDELVARIAADELAHTSSPVSYSDIIRFANLDPETRRRVLDALAEAKRLPMHIDASGGLSMIEIEARARMVRDRRAREGGQLGLVLIDYLGLVRRSNRYRGNSVEELGEIACTAKGMSKRLQVPVVLIAQLNRALETREDKRPVISDLRASGEIEEHADVIGLLYRSAYYLEHSAEYRSGNADVMERAHNEKYKLELTLGKNRIGSTRTITLWCDVALSSVENWRV